MLTHHRWTLQAAGVKRNNRKYLFLLKYFHWGWTFISHPSNCARKRVSPISRDCRPWRSPPRRSWRTTARCPPGSSQSPAARSSQSQGGWGLLSHQSPNLLLGQSGALRHHYWHRQNDITDALVYDIKSSPKIPPTRGPLCAFPYGIYNACTLPLYTMIGWSQQ